MRISLALLVALCIATRRSPAQTTSTSGASARAEIEAFNTELASATRKMDNAATLALWADDGVSLLPSTKPIEGKAAIGAFFAAVMSSMPHARMLNFDMQCHDIQVSGDWASEWCAEHQIVEIGDGKPQFDGRGKMLFVMHRAADGRWRLKTEMWNQAVAEDAAPK